MKASVSSATTATHPRPPRRATRPHAHREGAPHAPPERPRAGRQSILVVDDDPVVRDALVEVLTGEGFIALPAGGGLQALAFAASRPVDLVLLDLNLLGQSGWDTFERLTADYAQIPVIIITARPDQLATARTVGADALLEKPLDIPRLLQTIARLLAAPPAAQPVREPGRKAEFLYQPSGHRGESHEGPESHRGMADA